MVILASIDGLDLSSGLLESSVEPPAINGHYFSGCYIECYGLSKTYYTDLSIIDQFKDVHSNGIH